MQTWAGKDMLLDKLVNIGDDKRATSTKKISLMNGAAQYAIANIAPFLPCLLFVSNESRMVQMWARIPSCNR
jgi:hypothetical protein